MLCHQLESRPLAARKTDINTRSRRPEVAANLQTTLRPAASNNNTSMGYTNTISTTGARDNPLPTIHPPVNTPSAPSSSLPRYMAIYPFAPQEGGEISFEKGDTMEIVTKDENG